MSLRKLLGNIAVTPERLPARRGNASNNNNNNVCIDFIENLTLNCCGISLNKINMAIG